MTISQALLVATLAASQTVYWTGWSPPSVIDFRVDSTMPGGTADWAATDARHTPTQYRRLVDRACVAWNRQGVHKKTCRVYGSAAVSDVNGVNFNLVDEAQMWGTPPQPLGLAWCWGNPATECDFYVGRGNVFGTYSTNSGLAPIAYGVGGFPGNARPGAPNRADLYTTTLHEIGHNLGLAHPGEGLTPSHDPQGPVDCNPAVIDCPVMTQTLSPANGAARVSYWPNIFDAESLRARWGGLNIVQVSTWSISANGTLIQNTSWEWISGITTKVPPRISCRPGAGANGNASCILTTNSGPGQSPRFHSLDVTPTSVSINTTRSSGIWAEGPVDVAFGESDRFLAVAKRAANMSQPAQLILYSGNVAGSGGIAAAITGSGTLPAALNTHTEPRISYSETRDEFLATHPDTAGFIRLSTWDLNGNFLAQFNPAPSGFPEMSLWPVEVACDNHLTTASTTCQLYYMAHSELASSKDSFVRTGQVWLTNTTGSMLWLGADFTHHLAPLVSDATTYGRNGSAFVGNAYFLATDRFVTSSTSHEAAVVLDTTGWIDPADISTGTFDCPFGWTNVTSWDWNESINRFVVVRMMTNI
jgi:hypothetical protein